MKASIVTAEFTPGDEVIFNDELHVVLFVVPPNTHPSKFEAEIDEAFKKYTPFMHEKEKRRYQQGGVSMWLLKPYSGISYMIAQKIPSIYEVISVRHVEDQKLQPFKQE